MYFKMVNKCEYVKGILNADILFLLKRSKYINKTILNTGYTNN